MFVYNRCFSLIEKETHYMNYVNLGSTGLKVSRICLGMMTYGTPKWRPWVFD